MEKATKGIGTVMSTFSKPIQMIMVMVLASGFTAVVMTGKSGLTDTRKMYLIIGILLVTAVILILLSLLSRRDDLKMLEKQTDIQKNATIDIETQKADIQKRTTIEIEREKDRILTQTQKSQAIEKSIEKASEKALEWVKNPPNIRKLSLPMGNDIYLELKTIRQKKVVLIRNGNQVVGKFDLP